MYKQSTTSELFELFAWTAETNGEDINSILLCTVYAARDLTFAPPEISSGVALIFAVTLTTADVWQGPVLPFESWNSGPICPFYVRYTKKFYRVEQRRLV